MTRDVWVQDATAGLTADLERQLAAAREEVQALKVTLRERELAAAKDHGRLDMLDALHSKVLGRAEALARSVEVLERRAGRMATESQDARSRADALTKEVERLEMLTRTQVSEMSATKEAHDRAMGEARDLRVMGAFLERRLADSRDIADSREAELNRLEQRHAIVEASEQRLRRSCEDLQQREQILTVERDALIAKVKQLETELAVQSKISATLRQAALTAERQAVLSQYELEAKRRIMRAFQRWRDENRLFARVFRAPPFSAG